MTGRNQHYPPELRERAVRMVAEVTPNCDSQWAAINAVAQKLGVGTAETVRKWVRQAEGQESAGRRVAARRVRGLRDQPTGGGPLPRTPRPSREEVRRRGCCGTGRDLAH